MFGAIVIRLARTTITRSLFGFRYCTSVQPLRLLKYTETPPSATDPPEHSMLNGRRVTPQWSADDDAILGTPNVLLGQKLTSCKSTEVRVMCASYLLRAMYRRARDHDGRTGTG